MTPIEHFSVKPLRADSPGKRRLFFDQGDTGVVVHGERIARQYKIEEFFLIIADYDYYDGVSYWFYLLSSDFTVLDVMSTPDFFGFIEKVDEEDESQMTFSFLGSAERWRLAVTKKAFWSFSPEHLRYRANRHLFGKRRLCLSHVQQ